MFNLLHELLLNGHQMCCCRLAKALRLAVWNGWRDRRGSVGAVIMGRLLGKEMKGRVKNIQTNKTNKETKMDDGN